MNNTLLRLRCALVVAVSLAAAGCATVPAPQATSTPVAAPKATPAPTASPVTNNPGKAALIALQGPSLPRAEDAARILPDGQSPSVEGAGIGEPPAEPIAVTDLWERIRRGYAIPDLESDLVRDRERYYAQRPDYVQRMTLRASRYLFHIVEEVESRGMPTELALLPFIESAFNPQAMSVAKASGMWQFIPSTGKYFDLRQNLFQDERRDVLASTKAALDYLAKLHGMFGDWHLALAAYNWGEGSVQRAIARNQKAGLPTDYQSLRMPTETRYYVPKLQAVKNIVRKPAQFGLNLPPIENHPYFLTVAIQRDIDVDTAVQLAGLTKDEFMALNPQMNKPVILASGTPQLLLPYDNARKFIRNLGDHQGPLATWTAWVVPRTMRPAEAARQAGMEERELRQVNKIPPHMLVKAGSTLLVQRNERKHVEDVSADVIDNASIALAPEASQGRRRVVRANASENVASLARRVGVSAADLAQWNGLTPGDRLKKGQQLVAYVKAPAPKGQAKRTTVAAKTPAKAAPKTAAAKPANRAAATASNNTSSKNRVNVAKQ